MYIVTMFLYSSQEVALYNLRLLIFSVFVLVKKREKRKEILSWESECQLTKQTLSHSAPLHIPSLQLFGFKIITNDQ